MIDDILDVLRGNPTGDPLLSLWRHYPRSDLDPETLTKATVTDYRKYKSDIIKLSPHGRFCVADFGCGVTPGSTERGESGSTRCSNTVIKEPKEWEELERVDPNDGHFGMQLDYIRKMKEELPEVPMMMTLFSPTMIARKLSANMMPQHLLESDNKQMIRDAIAVIDDVINEFAAASVDAGAEGLFTAIQELDRSAVPEKQMNEMIELNSNFMKNANNKAEFTVLHLHGSDVAFEKGVNAFNPTAINWHDQTSGPSLDKASELFDGGLLGGLEPQDVLDGNYKISVQEAKQLREEIPLILAPGCVLLQGTDNDTIDDIVQLYR